jgi:hypothetical protein
MAFDKGGYSIMQIYFCVIRVQCFTFVSKTPVNENFRYVFYPWYQRNSAK